MSLETASIQLKASMETAKNISNIEERLTYYRYVYQSLGDLINELDPMVRPEEYAEHQLCDHQIQASVDYRPLQMFLLGEKVGRMRNVAFWAIFFMVDHAQNRDDYLDAFPVEVVVDLITTLREKMKVCDKPDPDFLKKVKQRVQRM